MIFDNRLQRALIVISSEDLIIAPLGATQRVLEVVERQIPGVRFCDVRSCRRLKLRGFRPVAVIDGRTRHDPKGKVQGKEGKRRAQCDGVKPWDLSLISASCASRCRVSRRAASSSAYYGLAWQHMAGLVSGGRESGSLSQRSPIHPVTVYDGRRLIL